jgi:hypothetical protein
MFRRLLSHLTYANVMATFAVFVALGGTAVASVIITSNSQVGPGTISGHKPPSGDIANVIGGSVNGQDVAANSLSGANILESSLTGNVHNLIYNATASTSPPNTTIATVGPYTIKGQCFVDSHLGVVVVRLIANGPAGTADTMYDQTTNDASGTSATVSSGLLIPANSDTVFAGSSGAQPGQPGDYLRIGGTAMLRSGSLLVEVDFNAVADNRTSGSCFIYGTATRAT